jgi:hypothetical protein
MVSTPNGNSQPDDPFKKILTPKPHHLEKDFIQACDLMDRLTPQQRLEICTAQLLAIVHGSGHDVYYSANKDPAFFMVCAFGKRARDLAIHCKPWLDKGDNK